ncbi:hypothetical protein [uncultured Parabacteroides sp.]|uniref:hypothetical protein n=1 Tax=uncultured Parabacteroides sp. TaxID=512312 RepID=UPI002605EC0B|nr:hypothetical protein [uncultured Parabacteroides sp.]
MADSSWKQKSDILFTFQRISEEIYPAKRMLSNRNLRQNERTILCDTPANPHIHDILIIPSPSIPYLSQPFHPELLTISFRLLLLSFLWKRPSTIRWTVIYQLVDDFPTDGGDLRFLIKSTKRLEETG